MQFACTLPPKPRYVIRIGEHSLGPPGSVDPARKLRDCIVLLHTGKFILGYFPAFGSLDSESDMVGYQITFRSMLFSVGRPANIIANSNSRRRIATTRSTPVAPATPSPQR